jgi:toluene monooxygenase electron transfer component
MKIAVRSKSGDTVFDCDDRETILHAGLRQGLNLPYECATGTCGTCRARVMSGDVEMGWTDAPGAKWLKLDLGDILMCQTRARSDCSIRIPSEIATFDQVRPSARRGTIRAVRNLTSDVLHFEVQLSAPMKFEPGQFVIIEAPNLAGGRAYSMVNFEPVAEKIDLVLKQKPGGGFSEWIVAQTGVDPEVKVFGPLGHAVFRPEEKKSIVCIAGGSGIAGMMSILESAVRADHFHHHKCTVFFGVRTLADAFYLETLSRYVAASHGNLEVTIALSHETATNVSHADYPLLRLASGMVHDAAGRVLAKLDAGTIAYVAGPPIMVDAAIRTLIVSGLPNRNIRYDKFG